MVGTMRRRRENIALGGQQAHRLTELRQEKERKVREKNNEVRNNHVLNAPKMVIQPVPQTIETIIANRLEPISTKATRLREKIQASRGGIQTERSDCPRPMTTSVLDTHSEFDNRSQPPFTAPLRSGVHQHLVGVRRSGSNQVKRKLTREELEWIEKQLQFTQRVMVLEKECKGWWQTFYAAAGASGIQSNHNNQSRGIDSLTVIAAIQRCVEDSEQERKEDIQTLQQQLASLREQCNTIVQHVQLMRDGTAFFPDLQEEMDALEQAMAQFRTKQRATFDTYLVEEKLLTRDLSEMLERLEEWEQEALAPKQNKLKPIKRTDLEDNNSKTTSPPFPEGREIEQINEAGMVKRVRQLDNMILHLNGQNGGWDDREQAVFTSTLLKCGLTDSMLLQNHLASQSNEPQQSSDEEYETLAARFLRRCMKSIITKSEKAVRQHLEWYINYIYLVHEKKETIARWKQQKEHARDLYIQQGLHNINEYADTSLNLSQLVGYHSEIEKGEEGIVIPKQGSNDKKKQIAFEEEQRLKERARRKEQLEAWKQEKAAREEQKRIQEQEHARLQAAQDAKRRQEVLEKKQQVLLYKLQKEQANAVLESNNHNEASSPASSTVLNDELRQRSRKAIQLAKERRAKLEAIEQDKIKQRQLPERPTRSNSSSPLETPSPTGSNDSPTLHKPTKAIEAKSRSKMDVRRMERERKQQGAHDAYFSGATVMADVKLSTFGHKPIAPRAIPNWRRNLPV